ncbi:uncharacterized protein LOC130673013 [Microplitis mediator]|uniref:uncharacterized protein LOC130673013 n=1 Tax=Microplitis mediator TaxID=375433 RepID=UPI00255623B2|nr:uncharacterized protein LOC130673013 [Microplitis mediator]
MDSKTTEDIVDECSCASENCYGKTKYPNAWLEDECYSFEQYILNIELILKERSKLKSKPQDDPEVQSELSLNGSIVAAHINLTYKCDARLQKCPYVNQLVKNSDYGKKFMDLKENSEMAKTIIRLGNENMAEISKNPCYYVDTYLQQ